jgi:flagellar motor switch protein FliN/FliY
VGEAMNQMMGSAATAMAEMLGRRVDISAPRVELLDLTSDDAVIGLADGPVVRVAFQLRVGELLDTALMQLMPLDFARALVGGLVEGAQAPAGAADGAPPAAPDLATGGPAESVPGPEPDDDRHLHAVPATPAPVAQPVAFPSLDEMPPAPGGSDISLLLDVPLQVTVELGRTQLRIREVLELVPGSIVELDKLAGEPVEVLVNGKQIARGEVVVIDEEFGVRITDVASHAKRLRGLAAEES